MSGDHWIGGHLQQAPVRRLRHFSRRRVRVLHFGAQPKQRAAVGPGHSVRVTLNVNESASLHSTCFPIQLLGGGVTALAQLVQGTLGPLGIGTGGGAGGDTLFAGVVGCTSSIFNT